MNYLYIEINFFPIAILCLILFNSHMRFSFKTKTGLFSITTLMTLSLLIVETVAWILDGNPASWVTPVLWILNTLDYLLIALVPFSWFMYVYAATHSDNIPQAGKLVFIMLPSAVLVTLALLSHVFGFFFSINADNHYVRGPLFLLQVIISFAYLAGASVLALIKRRSEKLIDKRREYLYLSCFVIAPLIGGIAQTFLYGSALIWSCTALSILMVYINTSNREKTTDALTGLNNRGNFDRFVETKTLSYDPSVELYLILCDIDHFKVINDVHGHAAGDDALKQVASAFKTVFGSHKSFIARFGGDEFAVLLQGCNESSVKTLIGALNSALEIVNFKKINPYHLSLSCGYARFGAPDILSAKQLIVAADTAMYEVKEAGSDEVEAARRRR